MNKSGVRCQESGVKITTKGLNPFLILLTFDFLLLTLMGCATIKETAKGFWGVSTQVLEDNRKSAITKTFNYDYSSCYAKTLDILKRTGTYIYMQNIKKYMIAIYVSEADTTPVGLFFKEIDKTNTQIEVSSPSTYAKEFMAKNVFSVLDKSVTLEELEARIHAKEEMGDK